MPKAKTRKYSRKYKRGGMDGIKKRATFSTFDPFPTPAKTLTIDESKKVKPIPGNIDFSRFPQDTRFDEAKEQLDMSEEDRRGQTIALNEAIDAYNQPMEPFFTQDNTKNECTGYGCNISGGRKTRRYRRKGRKHRKSRKSRKY